MYRSDATFRAHKKSKTHMSWVTLQESKDTKVRSKEFENEIERLKRRLIHKEEIEMELLMRIHQLESELAWYKNQYIQ